MTSKAVLISTALVLLPLLSKAMYSEQLTERKESQPTIKSVQTKAHILARHQSPVSAPSLDDLKTQGQQAYRRSCVHCHGIDPTRLMHRHAQQFERVVLEGLNDMPALSFKLSAEEVETIRVYISVCTNTPDVC